ncbi:MAG: hypothetical protein IJW18_06345 [Lachnospiraceae bacterium]|nr:hypothetical protein [Lachnospiraceae bacterium]
MKKLTIAIIIVLVAVVGLGFYWKFSQKGSEPTEIETEITELTKVLAQDLENKYPETPKAVVKLYARITKCFYEQPLTDEELNKLVDMSFALFDEELLALTPREEYVPKLKAVIKEYSDAKRVITSYEIQDSKSIDKYTYEGRECAKVGLIYNFKEITTQEKSGGCGKSEEEVCAYYSRYEEFILRKDDNGDWKILVWAESSVDNEE